MAQLCARAGLPLIDIPVDDNAAAHACSQREQYGCFAAFGRAGDHLAQGSAVGVVAQAAGQARQARQGGAKGHVVPIQVVGIDDLACVAVADARAAHADARTVGPGKARLFHKFHRQAGHIGRDLLPRALRLCGNAALFQQLIVLCNDACGDICTAQINADRITHCSDVALVFRAGHTRVLLL